MPTALAVALVCEGGDGTKVCPIGAAEAVRLVDWVRGGDPSIDPRIGRAVEILEEQQQPPRLVAYAIGDWHLTLSVDGVDFDSQVSGE